MQDSRHYDTLILISFLLRFEAFMSFPSDLEGLNFNFRFAVAELSMDVTILHSTETVTTYIL